MPPCLVYKPFAMSSCPSLTPSVWIQRFADLIQLPLPVLDLACGSGRHAHFLASRGHQVIALDRDAQALALAGASGVSTLQLDLEVPATDLIWPFANESLAAIIVTNYLHRPLFPYLLNSLAANGVLIMETFAQGNAAFGKPANPAFLLRPGELLDYFHPLKDMRILAYEDGRVLQPREAMVQRICVIKQSNPDDYVRFGPL